MGLKDFVPSHQDEEVLHHNFAILAGRVLMKHMPFFEEFGKGLEKHIAHEYQHEMSMKSEVVRIMSVYVNGYQACALHHRYHWPSF